MRRVIRVFGDPTRSIGHLPQPPAGIIGIADLTTENVRHLRNTIGRIIGERKVPPIRRRDLGEIPSQPSIQGAGQRGGIPISIQHGQKCTIFAEPPFRPVFEFETIALIDLIPGQGCGIEARWGGGVLQRRIQTVRSARPREMHEAPVRQIDSSRRTEIVAEHVLIVRVTGANSQNP